MRDDIFQPISTYLVNDALKGQGNKNTRTDYQFIDKNLTNDMTYTYRLADVNINGNRIYHKAIKATPAHLNNEYSLQGNYPNPFNPGTYIQFNIPDINENSSNISLLIFDVLGRKVRDLSQRKFESGTHTIYWDGKRDDGVVAESGIYFIYFKANDYSATKRMVLLK